ncbi:HK97 family phage prohead protease [Corallococcus sp. AB032C]|uniref:HK97 family phage prohead protease n=1 Tax=Corallococcus sp. AB032C TaxID=2316717 RepID=UPI000EF6EB5B|nr:HK97 family phage prohead protease [Corallococcus sp. AB032C]
MNELEVKSFSFEVKSTDDNTFEGYASVFGNVDSYGDVVEKGAFKKTILERGHKVKVLWQHDPWTPIGKAIYLEEDNHGLFVKAKISQTEEGKRAMTLIKDGVIDVLSIGFSTVKDEWDNEKGIRHIKEVKLYEFSPVTFAANDQAVITAAKNDSRLMSMLYRFNQELKAGKVLSGKNRALVEQAIQALQALLDAADESENNQKQGQGAEEEKHAQEVLKMIQDIKQIKF